MISLDSVIADKIDDHIEWSHQVCKRLERRYQCVTDFTLSKPHKLDYKIYYLILLWKLNQNK